MNRREKKCECCARGGCGVMRRRPSARARGGAVRGAGARGEGTGPRNLRVPERPRPHRTLPPRPAAQRVRPAPTWLPAAAGSRATSQPSGPSQPWTRRPSACRSARPTAPRSPGAAVPRWHLSPWRGEGGASPWGPAPTATATSVQPATPAAGPPTSGAGRASPLLETRAGARRAHARAARALSGELRGPSPEPRRCWRRRRADGVAGARTAPPRDRGPLTAAVGQATGQRAPDRTGITAEYG